MKIVIIGGGATGLSAGLRLRRLDNNAEIIIIEKSDTLSVSYCGFPYYLEGIMGDSDDLVSYSPEEYASKFRLTVYAETEALQINRDRKSITLRTLPTQKTWEESYQFLILALGSSPILLSNKKNECVFSPYFLSEIKRLEKFIEEKHPMSALIIGGGPIGIEMAEALTTRHIRCTLIEKSETVLSATDSDMVGIVLKTLAKHKITVLTNSSVKEIKPPASVVLDSGVTLHADMIVVNIGKKPNIDLPQKAGLLIGKTGALQVNQLMQTNDPDIYAGGECVEIMSDEMPVKSALAGPAAKQGRLIADNITGETTPYKNYLPVQMIKCFDRHIGSVGKTEKELKAGTYRKIILSSLDKSGYMPHSHAIYIKLLFDNAGFILGGQVIGKKGIDKRTDVLASLIRFHGNINDLVQLNLSYAPPYSLARDSVNLAGMMAQNVLRGLLNPCFIEDIEQRDKKTSLLIDLRDEEMYRRFHLEGAVQKDITELTDKDQEIFLYCYRGYTSYSASRYLMNKGFSNVKVLLGGITFYRASHFIREAFDRGTF